MNNVGAVNAHTGAFLDAFFAQLAECGVHQAVVSPGSRSTPLAMKAFEHFGDVWIDIDERGAAFLALGMAKESGVPVALICTSGTAVGNWLPAVLEAEASHIPLLLLSADRPAHLQGVGAPQTTNQSNMFGSHVRLFTAMPELGTGEVTGELCAQAAHYAQVAVRESAHGVVHYNFPCDEPLKPAPREARFESYTQPCAGGNADNEGDYSDEIMRTLDAIAGKTTVIVAGEGAGTKPCDAQAIIALAHRLNVPILADPLSGIRAYTDTHIITNYDAICTHEEEPHTQAIIRFGHWNVSKRLVTSLARQAQAHIVIDPHEALDYTHTATLALRAPIAVVADGIRHAYDDSRPCHTAINEWRNAEKQAGDRIREVYSAGDNFEGSYVAAMLEHIPHGSLLFSANSMAIRALDTFMGHVPIRVAANRGLNGIDGTTSTAIGMHAAGAPRPSTYLTGDLTLLHDINAFALAPEIRRHGCDAPFVVVCLNNHGGGIFDMLPQRSSDAYFERLFLTPHSTDFSGIATMFDVAYQRIDTIADFIDSYTHALTHPGFTLLDVQLPLEGVPERYRRYW